MDAERFRRLQQLFKEAFPLEAEERQALLDRECSDDATLRSEVESLLESGEDAVTLALEKAVADAAAGAGAPAISIDAGADAPERIGPYRLMQQIGEGGMGEVWLAEQVEPVKRTVAIKLIKQGMDTREVVARFEAERQALAMMDHPCVAKVFEAGSTPEGRPYFVMEYVKGVPITEHCNRHKLTNRERLELFLQVCEGVQHAHQKAIIHRDLKPSNVLVAFQDGKPVPKIIDFGVAKATAQRLTEKTVFTQLGVLIGTPEYMSPEQAEMTAEDVDTRTDVYSLGVILYELLVGALPFDAKELRSAGFDEIRRKIREDEPMRPSTRLSTLGEKSTESALAHRTDVPALQRQLRGDLDWITMKALEKSRARRYGSPQEFAADIRRHLTDEPVLASPPSTAYRARKFARRHRVGVGVAAAGVIVLALFATAMTVQAGRIARERDRANLEAELATRVSGFMTDLFRVSNPSEARGNSITARELLDKGAREIKSGLADQPELKARLMLTMGNVYSQLGLYDAAEPLLEESRTIREDLFGDEASSTLNSTNSLASLYGWQGRHDESERLFRETLATRKRLLGENHPDTLTSKNNLAWIYLRQARFDEAEPIYLDVLDVRRRTLGDDHRDTVMGEKSLAWLYYKQTRYDEAATLYLSAVETSTRLLGPDHPESMGAVNGLASVYMDQGRADEAEPLFLELLESYERVYGEGAAATMTIRNNLAMLYQNQGRLREKEELDLGTLAVKRRVLGDEHPGTLNTLNGLAITYWKTGRLDEAETMLGELLEARKRVSGPEHLDTLGVMNNLAGVYANQHRYDDAEALHRKTHEIKQRTLGDNHVWTLTSMMALGGVQTHRGEYDEAGELLESARHSALVAKLGEQHLYVGYSHYYLAGLAASLDRSDEAIAHLRQALDNGWAERDILEDETLDSLRANQEFQAIVIEVQAKLDAQ